MMYERKQQENRRITGIPTDIDRNEVLHFYKKRAEKYKEENPYAVTMMQDNNPQLVQERNRKEMATLLPFLALDSRSKILDIACGIGRWYDAIDTEIKEYCGVDFCEELVRIARKKHKDSTNADFLIGSAMELRQILKQNQKGTYNRVLMSGILLYFNDADIGDMLNQISYVTDQDTILCIREPIGISDRLTLKGFYSEELEDNYNAIYRTRDELMNIFDNTLISAGFQIEAEGWLFEGSLNNRKETAQYYFVFRKKGLKFRRTE